MSAGAYDVVRDSADRIAAECGFPVYVVPVDVVDGNVVTWEVVEALCEPRPLYYETVAPEALG